MDFSVCFFFFLPFSLIFCVLLSLFKTYSFSKYLAFILSLHHCGNGNPKFCRTFLTVSGFLSHDWTSSTGRHQAQVSVSSHQSTERKFLHKEPRLGNYLVSSISRIILSDNSFGVLFFEDEADLRKKTVKNCKSKRI